MNDRVSLSVSKFAMFVAAFVLISGCASKSVDTKKAAQLRMEIGVSHIQQNNLPMALKELLAAKELDVTNPYIHNNLGLVYFLRQKNEVSADYFKKAFTILPSFTEAKNNLARVYIEMRQFKKAEPLLNEVMNDLTFTDLPSAQFNYGLLYFNQGKYNQAEKFFHKVLTSRREDCYSHVYYGRSLLELQQLKAAAVQLDKAVQFCTPVKVDDALFYSAIAHYRLGLKDKSQSRFSELIKVYPEGKHHTKAAQMLELIQRGYK